MRSIAGVELKRLREAAGLTQAQFAELAGIEEVTQRFYERGIRRPGRGRAASLASALHELQAGPEVSHALLKAIWVEERIIQPLLDEAIGVDELRDRFTEPLTRAEGQWLVKALANPDVLDATEKARAAERLGALRDIAARACDDEAAIVRLQASYYLARSDAAGVGPYLAHIYDTEPHPMVRRSLAIGLAFLGDEHRLAEEYLDRLNTREEGDSNLAFMAHWCGERRCRGSEAFTDRDPAAWSGSRTLRWLVADLDREPELLALNVRSIEGLLDRKGDALLVENASVGRTLAKRLLGLSPTTRVHAALSAGVARIMERLFAVGVIRVAG
jgi:transcriptional regulator with XRE-family HTH domain